MDFIIDFVLTKWPNLLGLLLYVILFLPILFLNIITFLAIVLFPIIGSVIYFIPDKYTDVLKNESYQDELYEHGYLAGRYIRKTQILLTENFSYSFIRKFIIIPVQKKILDNFLAYYTSFFNGFINTRKEQEHSTETIVDIKKELTNWKKIMYYPFILIGSIIFSLLMTLALGLTFIPSIILILFIIQS